MSTTEDVLPQAAAELQQRAAPRAWPLLRPASDSVAVSADYFSPVSWAAVQQRRGPPRAHAAAQRGQTATSSTTAATGDVSATPLHPCIPSLSPAAAKASSSPHRTAATAEARGTASAASEAGGSPSLLLRSRHEQKKQRHRVVKLHPEIFEPPRLPASAALSPCGAASCTTDQRWLTRQDVSASLFTDSHSAGEGEQGAARPPSCQSAADACGAAGAFAAAAQREAQLVSFAAAAVADASSFSDEPAAAEEGGQGYLPRGAKAKRKPASDRKPGSLSATHTGEAGEGKSSGRNKNSKRGAAYQQQLMQLQAAAAADDAALLQALEAEQERIRQRRLQQEQERLRQQEEERRRQEMQAREAAAAAAAAAAREEQLRRERQAAEEQRRRLEEAEAKRKAQEEEERRRREQEEEQRRLQQQLQEQQRRQAEEAERQRQQREQEEQQRREKEQQQQMQQAQEQQPPQEAQQKQQDVGALQQQTESAQGEAGATTDTSAAISASNWLPALEAGKPETAYMREVQDLLLEERSMREAQLQQLPGVSEDQVKALRISIKKQINTALNQLASTTSQIIRTCEGIRQFMRGLKGHPPAVSQFFVAQACERLLQLTEKGAQVSTRPSSVWAYAFLIRGMVQEDEKVERAFRAHMYATCCYAAPFYYRKKQGMSVEQFRVARGQREGEDEEAFFCRMVACLRLWLSYLIASHKEEEAWSWLARFLNLNLATVKAVRRVCACALIEGLKIAGPALLKTFGRQFRKVMDLIQNALMPLLLTMQQKNEGTCISMYVTQLRTLLSDYYANNFTLPEPEGKSMKMEATEASPDV